MKPTGASARVFRDPSPPLPMRVRREQRSSAGPRPGYELKTAFVFREVAEGRGRREFVTEDMDKRVVLGGSSQESVPSRRSWIVGDVLGGIAMLLVMNLWASVLADWVSSLLKTGWSAEGWMGPSVALALYGSHLFGIASSHVSPREHSLGLLAILLFWGGILGAVGFSWLAGALQSLF